MHNAVLGFAVEMVPFYGPKIGAARNKRGAAWRPQIRGRQAGLTQGPPGGPRNGAARRHHFCHRPSKSLGNVCPNQGLRAGGLGGQRPPRRDWTALNWVRPAGHSSSIRGPKTRSQKRNHFSTRFQPTVFRNALPSGCPRKVFVGGAGAGPREGDNHKKHSPCPLRLPRAARRTPAPE